MLPQERQWHWKESELWDINTINNTVLYCPILKYWYASNKKLDENALVGEFVDWTDEPFPFAIHHLIFVTK